MQPLTALNRFFGYATFRGRQLEVIEHVLAGGHALVIMPTGMGKSLCYQIPSLIRSDQEAASASDVGELRGLTLVISPLIALMRDQVESLRARGIAAAYINSSLARAEREDRYAAEPAVVAQLLELAEMARDDLGDALTGRTGRNCRPVGRVENPVPLTRREAEHPFTQAEYD